MKINTKEDIINSLNNDIYNCILVSNNIIYKYFIPVRSYPTSFIRVQQNENKKNNNSFNNHNSKVS